MDRTTVPKVVEVSMTARRAGDPGAAEPGRLVPSAEVAAGMFTENRATPPSATRTSGSRLAFDTSLDLVAAEVPLGAPEQAPHLAFPSADTDTDIVGAKAAHKTAAEFRVPFTFTVTVRTMALSAATQAITRPGQAGTGDGRSMSFNATAVVRFAADEAPPAVPPQAGSEGDTARQRRSRQRHTALTALPVPTPVRSLSGNHASARFAEPARPGNPSLSEQVRRALSGVPETTTPPQITSSSGDPAE
ncbi:hypothetical protein [Streptomyces olivaceoviridis]|uniref:hypothetical protein n=1 Tax=Streptomyces olivaceoviridis TaxID=1921 RepID=UPI00331A4F8D